MQYSTFTENTFLARVAELLTGPHAGTHALHLEWPEGGGDGADGRHFCAVFLGRGGGAEDGGAAGAQRPRQAAVYRIAWTGPGGGVTAAWCHSVQRAVSVASLLGTCGDSTGEGGGLREFHVFLYPRVAGMHWVRAVDGFFGSQQYAVVRRAVTPSAASGGAAPAAVRVAAVLNPGLPPGRGGRGGDGCALATAAVLHAPRGCLCAAPAPALPLLRRATTRSVLPRVAFRRRLGAEVLLDDDNVCRMASVGTSYWMEVERSGGDGAPASTCMHGLVLVIDMSLAAWERAAAAVAHRPTATEEEKKEEEEEGAAGSAEWAKRQRREDSPQAAATPATSLPLNEKAAAAAAVGDAASADAIDPCVAEGLAAAVDAALSELAERNADLVAFVARRSAALRDTAGGREAAGAGGSATASALRSAVYADQMLARSIAESLASVIERSGNATFVREAERLVFGARSAVLADGNTPTTGGGGGVCTRYDRAAFVTAIESYFEV